MLEFSEESKRLVSTFLTYRNDVDIYTEDELKDKEFYKVLFMRLLDREIKINDITPLGSRDTVIERCKNEPENGRKKIFIIDGDVTFIHGKDVPTLKNLFVLDAYCIENYVIDKDSVVNFIYLNCAKKAKEEIIEDVQFEAWLGGYAKKLVDLFIHFGIIDLIGQRFTLYNAHKFHVKDAYSEELVEKEIEEMKSKILTSLDQEEYNSILEDLRARWDNSVSTLLSIVSGKDYLIPILLLKTQGFKSSKAMPSVEETKFHLVQYCNLDRLSQLKSVIQNL